MKKLFLLTLLAAPLFAQEYVVQKQTVLAAGAEVITVQQPTSSSRYVTFRQFYIDCSAACTVTLERNGAPATTTSLPVKNVNPNEGVASAVAFSASNVGVGTVIGTYALSAGGNITIDISNINFQQGSNQFSNLTIRTNSITATVNIIVRLTEKTL